MDPGTGTAAGSASPSRHDSAHGADSGSGVTCLSIKMQRVCMTDLTPGEMALHAPLYGGAGKREDPDVFLQTKPNCFVLETLVDTVNAQTAAALRQPCLQRGQWLLSTRQWQFLRLSATSSLLTARRKLAPSRLRSQSGVRAASTPSYRPQRGDDDALADVDDRKSGSDSSGAEFSSGASDHSVGHDDVALHVTVELRDDPPSLKAAMKQWSAKFVEYSRKQVEAWASGSAIPAPERDTQPTDTEHGVVVGIRGRRLQFVHSKRFEDELKAVIDTLRVRMRRAARHCGGSV
jgi:hypothetical protein